MGGLGDERQYLILGFLAWMDVSGSLLVEGLVESSDEAIGMRMVWGLKHQLGT